ncbi:MAG: hypothetical protein V1753_07215, partial [Pseudomonadota bacterium]
MMKKSILALLVILGLAAFTAIPGGCEEIAKSKQGVCPIAMKGMGGTGAEAMMGGDNKCPRGMRHGEEGGWD